MYTVLFGIPEDLAMLPPSIRERVIRTEPTADVLPDAAAKGGGLTAVGIEEGGRGAASSSVRRLRGLHHEPSHLIRFVQQSTLLHAQVHYLRSLSYYHSIVFLSGHMDALLLLQAALACLLGAALLQTPAAAASAASAATDPQPLVAASSHPLWSSPPLGLSLLHLGFSAFIAALYVVRFGPTIISHTQALSAAHTARSLTSAEQAAAAAAAGESEWMATVRPLGNARNAALLRARAAAQQQLGGGGSTLLRAVSLLQRLNVPGVVWMPLLHAHRSIQATLESLESALDHAALLSTRALLSDGTMALLAAQVVASALALWYIPPVAAALPLLSAVACVPQLRALVAALVASMPHLLLSVGSAGLAVLVYASIAAHMLPIACGDAGGPFACTDGIDCMRATVESAFIHAAGLREACATSAATATQAASAEAADGAVADGPIGDGGATLLPAFQVGLSLGLPTLFLAWAYASIRGGVGGSRRSGGVHEAAATDSRLSARWLRTTGAPSRRSGDGEGGGVSGGAEGSSGAALLAGLREPSPWQYCAFVCRVLATPSSARSPIERHVAKSLSIGGGVGWIPQTRA